MASIAPIVVVVPLILRMGQVSEFTGLRGGMIFLANLELGYPYGRHDLFPPALGRDLLAHLQGTTEHMLHLWPSS
jgi:hypothetical protein